MKHALRLIAAALASAVVPASASTATAQSGTLPLGRLSVLLDVPAVAAGDASPLDSPLLWFTDQALRADASYAAAARAYRQGLPVAILRGPAVAADDALLQSLFGVASPAALAVYTRGSGGTAHVHLVEDLPPSPRARQRLASHLLHGLAAELHAGARTSDYPAARAEAYALPRLSYTATAYAANGAVTTLQGEVVRNSGRSHDDLTLAMTSRARMTPHRNGRHGDTVVVPLHYTWRMSVTAPGSPALPLLKAMRPISSATWNVDIAEHIATPTHYSLAFSEAVHTRLAGKVPHAGAKAPFTQAFPRMYALSQQVRLKTDGYALANSAKPDGPAAMTVQWDAQLATPIVSDPHYFGRGNTGKMTSTMRQLDSEGAAVWSLPGDYTGTLDVVAAGSIANVSFPSLETSWDQPAGPRARLRVDTRSPYLTRDVTVLIHSEADPGRCLSDRAGVVQLAACPDTASATWQNALAEQWQLDTLGRYYNRGSGNCMQILEAGQTGAGGELVTRPCTMSRGQRWQWQADRIHSLHGDGNQDWRLFVGPDQSLRVRTTHRPDHPPLPVNPFHALLPPWSRYPHKPQPGDHIPHLDDAVPPQPISSETARLDASPARERWSLTVLRQSLHP